jgi:hypothetical protein
MSPSTLDIERKNGFPWWRFSLAELMVFTALLAICFSVWSVEPATSIFSTLYCLVASVRTLAAKRLAQIKGASLSIPGQIVEFIKSVVLVYAGILLAGMVVAIVSVPVILLYPGSSFTSSDPLSWLIVIGMLLIFFYVDFRFLKQTWPK